MIPPHSPWPVEPKNVIGNLQAVISVIYASILISAAEAGRRCSKEVHQTSSLKAINAEENRALVSFYTICDSLCRHELLSTSEFLLMGILLMLALLMLPRQASWSTTPRAIGLVTTVWGNQNSPKICAYNNICGCVNLAYMVIPDYSGVCLTYSQECWVCYVLSVSLACRGS